MASPTRLSDDYTKMSKKSPESSGDVKSTEIFKKLAKDDLSENAMLRSRIEEQGQLICYLKQRTDQQINRIKVLEDINNELQLLRKQSQDEGRERLKMCDMLEKRFNELAENHEEMIKIKDGYKSKCHMLSEENDRLNEQVKNGFPAAVKERDAMIENLSNELKQYKEKLEASQNQKLSLQSELSKSNARDAIKIGDLEKESALLRKKCEELTREVKRADRAKEEKDTSAASHTEAMRKENERMLDQIMNRGKLLQEKQLEIDELKTNVEKVESKLRLTVEEFSRKKHSVDANLRVQRLQVQKEAAESEMMRLKVEFEAFRLHSHHLLEQEKNLNLQLRNHTIAG